MRPSRDGPVPRLQPARMIDHGGGASCRHGPVQCLGFVDRTRDRFLDPQPSRTRIQRRLAHRHPIGRVGAHRHDVGPRAREHAVVVLVELCGRDSPVRTERLTALLVQVAAGNEGRVRVSRVPARMGVRLGPERIALEQRADPSGADDGGSIRATWCGHAPMLADRPGDSGRCRAEPATGRGAADSPARPLLASRQRRPAGQATARIA